MADGRRVGHAQRRRIGAKSNMYANTIKPPSYGPGDTVKARGRYRHQTVSEVIPDVTAPGLGTDGHLYRVSGGKGERVSEHLSGELSPFELGTEEHS